MRLLVGSRPWQAACLQEEIVRLLVVNVGLALSDLVLRYGAELDGFQRSSFELDIGDHAFPIDWFVEIYQCRRQLEDEISQIKKDGSIAINLHAMQEWCAMHHDDIRTRVYFRVRPFLQPVWRHQPFRQFFSHDRAERLIEDVVVLVHDDEIGLLPGISDTL